MTKKLFFDMDGTIADLYGTENWLEMLLAETKNLFRNLKVMHDKEKLTKAIKDLQAKGFEIGVITWTPKEVSEEYIGIVAEEKRNWIAEHFPMITEIHCLGYGVPKQNAPIKKSGLMILADDNTEVNEMWDTSIQRKSILADGNLIDKLNLLY